MAEGYRRLWYRDREEVVDDINEAIDMQEDITLPAQALRLLVGEEDLERERMKHGIEEASGVVRDVMSDISAIIKLVLKIRTKEDKGDVEELLSQSINDLDYALDAMN